MIGPSGFATLYGGIGSYGVTFAVAAIVMVAGTIAAAAMVLAQRRR